LPFLDGEGKKSSTEIKNSIHSGNRFAAYAYTGKKKNPEVPFGLVLLA